MMSLDLDEIENLSKRHWLFSNNRWNIYSIRDEDYLQTKEHTEDKQLTIKENLLAYLSTQAIDQSKIHRITLQTFPRIFGYQFNPVSFYYIEDATGNTIATVAEVGNTFHEKKIFFIDKKHKAGWFRLKTNKNFYVSPFSKVDDYLDFQVGPKNKKWSVNINDENNDGLVLASTIRGKRKSLSSLRLSWYIIRYPLLTIRVIFLIHWHALIMWMRKLPISNKKATASQQISVIRPHKSLTKK